MSGNEGNGNNNIIDALLGFNGNNGGNNLNLDDVPEGPSPALTVGQRYYAAGSPGNPVSATNYAFIGTFDGADAAGYFKFKNVAWRMGRTDAVLTGI
jgi:hypothetical protein